MPYRLKSFWVVYDRRIDKIYGGFHEKQGAADYITTYIKLSMQANYEVLNLIEVDHSVKNDTLSAYASRMQELNK